ncbi:caspase family protein [Streptomyces sp. DT197]|uniref:caspase family protein n=1 Tax=Streptomyces sp. DT197 TaxID=3393417 RepID=UPI003CEB48C1
MAVPDPRKSRAVVIGIGDYRHDSLASMPAAATGANCLARLLRDQSVWGLPTEHVTDTSAVGILTAVRDAAVATEDTLLVYFAGHGLRDLGGHLYLALTDADPDYPQLGTLPYLQLRDLIRQSGYRARHRVTILDCCYSGLAGGMSPATAPSRDELAHALDERAHTNSADEGEHGRGEDSYGDCVLTSAPAESRSFVRPHAEFPEFTGELIATLQAGITGTGSLISLETIWLGIRNRMRSRSSPEPQHFAQNNATRHIHFHNRATDEQRATAPSPNASPDPGPGPGAGAFAAYLGDLVPDPAAAEALRARRAEWKARVRERERSQSTSARNRQRLLLTRAEEIIPLFSEDMPRVEMTAYIAAAFRPVDTDRAERLAEAAERHALARQEVPDQVRALARVALRLGSANLGRARAVAERAESLAETIPNYSSRSLRLAALAAVAKGMAVVRPDRAEHIVLTEWGGDKNLLKDITNNMVTVDPYRALRIVRNDLPDLSQLGRDLLLEEISNALAGTDPDGAESSARQIEAADIRSRALSKLSRTLARSDPDRAEQIVWSIPDEGQRRQALANIFHTWLDTAPYRAEQLVPRNQESGEKSWWWASLVKKVAAADPNRAERIARAIPDEAAQAGALYQLFDTLRAVDQERALRVAATIPPHHEQEWARILAATAQDVTGTQPQRAQHLFDEAIRTAQHITDPKHRALAVWGVGGLLAETDRERGERLIRDITNPKIRLHALHGLAKEFADTDAPEQTAQFLAACVRIAAEGTEPTMRHWEIKWILKDMVKADPGWAARLATETLSSIPKEDRFSHLTSSADLLVDHVPDRAMHLATEAVHLVRQQKDGDRYNSYSMRAMVILALVDPRQAVRLATDTRSMQADEALERLVCAMVETAEQAGKDSERAR